MSVTITPSGIAELRAALEALPQELRNGSERTALRAGAKPVLKAAKGFLTVKDTGLLAASLGITVKKSRKKGIVTARVGPRGNFGQWVTRKKLVPQPGGGVKVYQYREYANPASYAHLIEYGTSKMAARPFMRPAIHSARGAVEKEMANGFRKGLQRAAHRARQKRAGIKPWKSPSKVIRS